MDPFKMRQATFGRNGRPATPDPPRSPVLALWQPDRPHNLGAALRLCACLDIELDVIEPAGFPLDPRRIREAALDYGPLARWQRHADLAAFLALRRGQGRRLVLLSTAAGDSYHRASFEGDDVLLVGNESRGVPGNMHDMADLRLRIPMASGRRSLNVVTAAAIVLGEALRQTGGLDRLAADP